MCFAYFLICACACACENMCVRSFGYIVGASRKLLTFPLFVTIFKWDPSLTYFHKAKILAINSYLIKCKQFCFCHIQLIPCLSINNPVGVSKTMVEGYFAGNVLIIPTIWLRVCYDIYGTPQTKQFWASGKWRNYFWYTPLKSHEKAFFRIFFYIFLLFIIY